MKKIKIIGGFVVAIGMIGVVAVGAGEKPKKIQAKEYEIAVKKNKDKFDVTTVGRSGFHCNTMYPWKITTRSRNGKETIYKKKDAKVFGETSVSFLVDGTEATLKLSVCNDQQCVMKTEKIKLE